MSRDTFSYNRLLIAPCNLALNIYRDGKPTTTLGNLFQILARGDWRRLWVWAQVLYICFGFGRILELVFEVCVRVIHNF